MNQGTFLNGACINNYTNQSLHILKFDTDGNFISGNHVDFTSPSLGNGNRIECTISKTSGNIFINRYHWIIFSASPLFAGGNEITHTMFVAAFDPQGNFLWKQENMQTTFGDRNHITLDPQDNVYFTGKAISQNNQNNILPDSFAGFQFSVENPEDLVPQTFFVVKMNAQGQGIWAINGSYDQYEGRAMVINNDELAITKSFSRVKIGPTNHQTADGNFTPEIIRLNKNTGAVIEISTTQNPQNSITKAEAIEVDPYGNYYLGGAFGATLQVGSNQLNYSGGKSDFFYSKIWNIELFAIV